jgi:hypothetical protein
MRRKERSLKSPMKALNLSRRNTRRNPNLRATKLVCLDSPLSPLSLLALPSLSLINPQMEFISWRSLRLADQSLVDPRNVLVVSVADPKSTEETSKVLSRLLLISCNPISAG